MLAPEGLGSKKLTVFMSFCFEVKSLILAQIERWRHALHMQVERQQGWQPLVASGERVSNTSERAL